MKVLVGWLVVFYVPSQRSHRQRGHLETVTPFTVPCEGCEARFLHRRVAVHYTTAAPHYLHKETYY